MYAVMLDSTREHEYQNMVDWCTENMPSRFSSFGAIPILDEPARFWFRYESDLLIFTLRFGHNGLITSFLKQ